MPTPSRPVAADWLALREPLDAAARLPASRRLAALLSVVPGRALRVVDIGSGTGANLRHLAPVLHQAGHRRQHWWLLDHDEALLAHDPWAGAAAPEGVTVERVPGRVEDLAGRLAEVETDLLTCSALLDLLSEPAAAQLAVAAARARAALLALSVDGAWSLDPAHPDDALVAEAFARHQAGSSEEGHRLGERGPQRVAELVRGAGREVIELATPWRLDSSAGPMLTRFLTDRVAAATELARTGALGPAAAARIRAWAEQRASELAAGGLSLVVGHVDLLVHPSP